VILRVTLALLLGAWLSNSAFAGGTCSGVKGGCGRSSASTSARSSYSGGTVHVNGYYRKDGTYVRPHTRRAPGTSIFDIDEAPSLPKVRTVARTSARTTYWNGNVTVEDEPEPKRVARTDSPRPMLATKYIVYLTSGRNQPLADYKQDGDSYLLYGTAGGHFRLPKSNVDRFEPVSAEANPPSESRLRIWTSADGKFTTKAEFISSEGGKVTLKKADGTVITVDEAKLSDLDKEWIRNHQEKAAVR
jgi:SLA1 homology domain 1, SHD1